jgi:hypothetical protein
MKDTILKVKIFASTSKKTNSDFFANIGILGKTTPTKRIKEDLHIT